MPSATTPPVTYNPLFQGAPFTKLSCMAWVVGHVVVHANKNGKDHNIHSPFLFASNGDLIMGLLWLVPNLRRVERELGSRQWMGWWGWCTGLSWGMGSVLLFLFFEEEAVTAVHKSSNNKALLSIPLVILGATLAHFIKFVPRLHPKFVGIFGMHLSEKALQIIWAMYVLSHDGVSSEGGTGILSASLGFLSSWLYFAMVPKHLPFLTIPDALIQLLPWESLGGLLLLDPPTKVYAPLLLQQQQQHQQQQGHLGVAAVRAGGAAAPRRRAAPPLQPTPPPSPEAIEQLVAMGFEEDRVRQALESTQNNVERAANLLLMG